MCGWILPLSLLVVVAVVFQRIFKKCTNVRLAMLQGALQDVKIVTQSHGYLLQCPNQNTGEHHNKNIELLTFEVRLYVWVQVS